MGLRFVVCLFPVNYWNFSQIVFNGEVIHFEGKANRWSHWSKCGITCGYRWGKRYRSHTCNLTENELMSEACATTPYFHVQPQWCFGAKLCPGMYYASSFGVSTARKLLLVLFILQMFQKGTSQ